MVVMLRINQMQEKASAFDKAGLTKREVDNTLVALKEFRQKFPFVENLREIEWLNPDRLFKVNPDSVGEFFQALEDIFKPLGYPVFGNSNVYRNARLQISDFKNLLRTAVDERKSLAQKIDAKWERIGGIGQDKQLPMKIVYCFNFESKTVLPVFSVQQLRYFVNRTVDTSSGPTKYFSLGQEYEHYTAELLKTKNSLPLARSWDNLYFARFLYATYPPPDSEPTQTDTNGERKIVNQVTDEQLDMQGFVKLLGELQRLHKITGEEFRENRAAWQQLKPNDREVLVLRLKQRLNSENTTENTPKSQPLQKRKL
jgi:hypothetical protein